MCTLKPDEKRCFRVFVLGRKIPGKEIVVCGSTQVLVRRGRMFGPVQSNLSPVVVLTLKNPE